MRIAFEIADDEDGKTSDLSYIGDEPANNEEALAVSISKWEAIVTHYAEKSPKLLNTGGKFTCGFCMLHIRKNCVDCPIYDCTGRKWCHGTPQADYCEDFDDHKVRSLRKDAKAELKFLKSEIADFVKEAYVV